MPYLGTGWGDDVRRDVSREDVREVVPCTSMGIGTLTRLGSREATVRNTDGSQSVGVWHWWTGASCPDPRTEAAQALARGEACPIEDVPGRTCIPRFYPTRTVWPDGRLREESWTWTGAQGGDDMGIVRNWSVDFTAEEAALYTSLSDDGWIRALNGNVAVAIYYSLLQYRCVDGTARLEPSPVSPQSLRGRYDTGSQFWLEYWEQGLRDRIWNLRPDLRRMRLPDGTLGDGLKDPRSLADETRPNCTSQATQLIGLVVGAALTLVGAPVWVSMLLSVPDTVQGFRTMIRNGNLMARVRENLVDAPTTGLPAGGGPSTPPSPQTGTGTPQVPASTPAAAPSGPPMLLLAALLFLL